MPLTETDQLLAQAQAELQAGRAAQASRLCESALELEPERPQAHQL